MMYLRFQATRDKSVNLILIVPKEQIVFVEGVQRVEEVNV